MRKETRLPQQIQNQHKTILNPTGQAIARTKRRRKPVETTEKVLNEEPKRVKEKGRQTARERKKKEQTGLEGQPAQTTEALKANEQVEKRAKEEREKKAG
ncbi:hypothetical protein BaRGS_00040414 [Batillaria attramentaria]|uniref:Uncharacterized protein n=1 Tax=Batillaria attramentaria TaxID=370345 RepID=A0ABD0J068_9CAEN